MSKHAAHINDTRYVPRPDWSVRTLQTVAFWRHFEACVNGAFELHSGSRGEGCGVWDGRISRPEFSQLKNMHVCARQGQRCAACVHAPLQEFGEVLKKIVNKASQICHGGQLLEFCCITLLGLCIHMCVLSVTWRQSMSVSVQYVRSHIAVLL